MFNKKKWSTIVFIALIVFVSISLIIAPFLYVQLLTHLDATTSFLTIVFPIVLALVSGLMSSVQLDVKFNEEFAKLENDLNTEKLPYYGTKFNVPKVPDKNTFWLSLLTNAEMEFIIVGRSNKHWIKQGGPQQLLTIGENIIRIVEAGGHVTIVSKNDPSVIEDTEVFFKNFIISPVEKLGHTRYNKVIKALQRGFIYTVVDHLNYNVVLSDERIMAIPSLNTHEFRDESIVLEIRKAYVSDAFQNYRNDIYNTIRNAEHCYFPGNWDTHLK